MSTLQERFALLEAAKPEITQADLARATGAKPPSVNDWFSGKTKSLSAEMAIKVAEIYGCSLKWLVTGIGPVWPTNAIISAPGPLGAPSAMGEVSNVTEIKNRPKVPLISWVQAGELSEVLDIFHPGEAVQWEDAIHSKPTRSAYALLVEGDSMDKPGVTPNFPAGTILIVDPERASHAGDYVIAKDVATQKATFKQLTTDGSRWYLKPLNTAYPTIEIDDPALRVIGRVIEFKPPGGKL